MSSLYTSTEFGENDKQYEFQEILTLMEAGEAYLDSVITHVSSGKKVTVQRALKIEAPELNQKIKDDIEENKFNIGVFIFGLVLLIVGVFAILYPDALEGESASGRRSGIKALIIWAWGTWSGILAIIVSGLIAVGIFSKGEYERFFKEGRYPKRSSRSSSKTTSTRRKKR